MYTSLRARSYIHTAQSLRASLYVALCRLFACVGWQRDHPMRVDSCAVERPLFVNSVPSPRFRLEISCGRVCKILDAFNTVYASYKGRMCVANIIQSAVYATNVCIVAHLSVRGVNVT